MHHLTVDSIICLSIWQQISVKTYYLSIHLLNFIRNSAWILPLSLNKLNSTVSCINYAATWKTNPGFRSLREFLTYGAFATLLQLSSKNIKNRMIAQFFVFFCCCKAHFQFSSELIQNNISCCVRRWWWWWKWQN